MTPIRGTKAEAVQTGYEAPIRKSLIDPDHLCGCPRLAFLALTFICGILYLQVLSGSWKARLFLCGTLWLCGLTGMLWLTRRDPQWMDVVLGALRSPDSLEV
jgi:type IV secretory pathway TrbD component